MLLLISLQSSYGITYYQLKYVHGFSFNKLRTYVHTKVVLINIHILEMIYSDFNISQETVQMIHVKDISCQSNRRRTIYARSERVITIIINMQLAPLG